VDELKRMWDIAGIVEVSLSRVYSHFKNKNIPIAIVTAFRDPEEKPVKKSIADNKSIASEARGAGYGYVFLDGAWQDPNTGEEMKEDSVMIIGKENDNGKLKGMVKNWVGKYNQDAALWKDEGSTEISLLFRDGSTKKIGQKFSPNTAQHGYTRLRGRGGRVFTFESAHKHKSWLGRWNDLIGD
jgi:hypothetical protein